MIKIPALTKCYAPFFITLISFLGIAMTSLPTASVAKNISARATHFSLQNGMDVVVISDHRAPVVTHMVWYRVGAADETPGKSGIAHFLEHLLFKGTKEIPSGEFSKIISRNGGQDNAFTGQDMTAYFQRVSKDRLPLVMKMEADRMVNLRLTENDVVTERKVILEERRSRVDNDPSSILSEQMFAALYVSHPYGIPVIGWEDDMKKLNLQDALGFYKHYYAPNNAILVVAGDVNVDEVRKLAEETYGKNAPNNKLAKQNRPPEPKPQAARRVVLKDPRAGQATVQRFYLAPSYLTAEPGEAEALDLLMKIVGSGTTSRIYKKMVVKEKKATSAGGWYSGSGRDSGRIGVYAVAAGETPIEDAEKLLDQVLQDVAANGVTQKELDRARNAYLAEYIYGLDSQSRLARRYGSALVTGGTIQDVEEWPEKLKKVVLGDLQRVAKKYLVEKRSVTGILLPIPKEAADQAPASSSAKKS